MFSFQYPLIRVGIVFGFGIYLGKITDFSIVNNLFLVGFLFGSLVYFLLRDNKFTRQTTNFLMYGLFLSTGMLVWDIHQPENQPSHYSNRYQPCSKIVLSGVISQTLNSRLPHKRYEVEVHTMSHQAVTGKLLLSVFNDTNSENQNLQIGDGVRWYSDLKSLNKPIHSSQFDYASYMRNKGVLYQSRVSLNDILIDRSLNSWAKKNTQYKTQLVWRLTEMGFTQDQVSVIKALFLGDKNDLSESLKQNYIRAGVMHVLAISGLHIGILLLFLQWVLHPLKRITFGKEIQLAIILFCLWGVAFFTGLSASVVRSVTMFTFLAVAMQSQRTHNIYNALFGSALVLLVVHPQFLFDVGFQLSYVAVLSIVTLQPIFAKFLHSKNKIIQYIYDIINVSLAAQLGVLPICLFYFHQFSGVFLWGNLMVIPLVSIILCFGIPIVMLLSFLDLKIVATIFSRLIDVLNWCTWFGASFSRLIFTEIYFSPMFLVLSYGVLICLVLYVHQKRFVMLCFSLVLVVFLQSTMVFQKYFSEKETLLFNGYQKNLIAENKGDKLIFYTDSITSNNNVLKQYQASVYTSEIEQRKLNNYVVLNSKKVLVLDQTALYLETPQPHIIILTHTPRINLDRLIANLHPQKIIADGSNYPYAIERWRQTCRQKNIPFQSTAEKGYCTIE